MPLFSYAFEPFVLRGDDVIVVADPALTSAAERAGEVYEVVKRDIEKRLSFKVDFKPTILLVKDENRFRKMAGTNLFVAFAVPKKKLIVIDNSKMRSHPFTIEATIKHELSHLLLHQYIKPANLPKWLDEGVAQWVSGGLAELVIQPRKSVLHEAALKDRIIPMIKLSRRFPVDQKALSLAYEESKSLVEYIVSQFGAEGMLLILQYLHNGDDFDIALLKVTSLSMQELESKWTHNVKKRMTWFTYISAHLYEFLFLFAAFISVWGFIKVFRKKRMYMKEEEGHDLER